MSDTDVLLAFGGEIKALGDGKLGGYLVRFTDAGRPDLTGDFFTATTDFDIEPGERVSVYYNHGLDATLKRRKLGSGSVRLDDVGVWVEAQLILRDEYEQAIYGMAKAGKLGWSSGTLPNLVEREPEGKAMRIVRWPLGKDASLTPTPAAGLVATAVQPLKAWLDTVGPGQPVTIESTAAVTEAAAPEDARPASAPAVDDATSASGETVLMEVVMTEEVKQAAPPEIDYDRLAAAIVAKQEAAKPAKSAGFVVEDEIDRKQEAGRLFGTFGEFLVTVKNFGQGVRDDRLVAIRSKDSMDEGGFSLVKALGDKFVGGLTERAVKAAPTDLGESLPQAGGYLVGSDRNTSILSRVYDIGALLQRVSMVGIGPNSNGMTFYAEDETSRATGSRRGGVRFYWVAENSAIQTTNPTFRKMELKLQKAAAAVYATDELLQDVSALESYIMRILPEEIRWGVEDSIINGTGTGQPLGILNAPCLVSVTKETGQAADTIVYENVLKMWSRLWNRSRANAVWLVNQDCLPQLALMSLPVGTAGVPVFLPPGGASGQQYGTLFGRPVIEHESCDTVGDKGDILLVDLSQYQMIEKGGIQSASSIHVRFLEDEQVFRFIYRVDGQPMWSNTLTPTNSALTQSPFIALNARA